MATKKATKKDKMAERMTALSAMATACHLTQEDVSRIVISFVRDQGFPNATDASNFTTDVPVDGITRRGWAIAIRRRIFRAGCDPKGFGPADCERARTVGDISRSAFRELQ